VLITPPLAADLIRAQFPPLAAGRVTVLETGWDNTALVVDGAWLFRFPRRAIALPGVRREIDLLPRLAAVLPLAVPDPEFVGQPSPQYPWPFWGARLLPGHELAEAGLADSRRGALAAALGRFLRALHEPGLVASLGAGLPADPMRRGSPQVRAGRARDTVGRLVRRGVVPADGDVDGLLDRAAAATVTVAPAPGDAGLVMSHGDLHLRHVLVDDAGAATGVIDWGDLCLADPAVDLSIAYAGFAGQPRAELLAAYGRPVSAAQELAARACAVSITASLAEYAADEGRAALLRESVAGLRRAVGA
jgi:aminoglycoside phosphotransferase (APT) family kinase protein